MEWAYYEAKKRNVNDNMLKIHLLSTLTSSYYYYNELFNQYDVSKIIKWNKNIYEELKNYEVTEVDIEDYLIINKQILETISNPIISYDEYLTMMEEYHD